MPPSSVHLGLHLCEWMNDWRVLVQQQWLIRGEAGRAWRWNGSCYNLSRTTMDLYYYYRLRVSFPKTREWIRLTRRRRGVCWSELSFPFPLFNVRDRQKLARHSSSSHWESLFVPENASSFHESQKWRGIDWGQDEMLHLSYWLVISSTRVVRWY